MFTGLISECGQVKSITFGQTSAVIVLSAPLLAPEICLGDSVAINGVCLTAISVEPDSFTADVMIQTLRKTSLQKIQAGAQVNLELAVKASDRLGGHIVQGHVDGVATVSALIPGEKSAQLDLLIPSDLVRYIVNQGSICVDGVSLTVGQINDQSLILTLWLIPETLARTNLASKKVGDEVNIEVDVLAKYVERLIQKGQL